DEPALEEVEDAAAISGAAPFTHVGVVGARDDEQLARLAAARVQPFHVVRRGVRVCAAADDENGTWGKLLDVVGRCKLGNADAEPALGDPDDAAAEAMEPRRIAAADPGVKRAFQIVVHAFENDRLELARARHGVAERRGAHRDAQRRAWFARPAPPN